LGAKIGGIIASRRIELSELGGKAAAVDAMNMLYSFLLTIKAKGEPLKDSRGRITSHLVGLLSRTINLIERGVTPVFVFDGKPPQLKMREIEKKKEARKRVGAPHMTGEMVDDAKKLIEYMGLPYVQAPSEGEAQAAHMCRKGDAYCVVSQDWDSLLFNAPRLVRNLTVTGRRKMPCREEYYHVFPEMAVLDDVLKELGITYEQLVAVGVCSGTDYCGAGLKGVGAKTALKIIKEQGTLEDIVKLKGAPELLDVQNIYLRPDVTDDYTIELGKPDADNLKKFLCEERNFSQERVQKWIDVLQAWFKRRSQQKIEKWL
jgi:flap endonuclease-1